MSDFTKSGVPFARTMEQADPHKSASCPKCKCEQIMFIEVPVFGGMIYGGEGTGTYLGCPACPWASLMQVVSMKEKEQSEKREHAIEEQKAREKAEAEESYHDGSSYDHDLEERWKDAEDGLSD